MNVAPVLKLAAVVLIAITAAGCAQNPVTGRQNFVMMSEADEVRTGRQADQEVRQEYGVYDLPALQQYVSQVGHRLAAKSHRPNLDYHFTVVDSADINAFALPGGYIYITRGIMAYLNSEAELAAVLAHEIGHVTARHSVQQYSAAAAANIGITLGSILVPELRNTGAQNLLNVMGGAILSGYGREHELEADRLGAEYLARAGYDPQAMVRVIGLLKNQELFDAEIAKEEGREPRRYHGLFASHPDNDTRLQQVVGEANRFAVPNGEEDRAAYLSHIDGVIFGDSPEQGIIRNGTLYHAGLGIAVDFPMGWKTVNSPERVVAASPGADATVELRVGKRPNISPADFLRQALKMDYGGRVESVSVNGLPSAIATGSQNGRPLKVGAIYFKDSVYVVLGSANSAAAFGRDSGKLEDTIRSFRPLSDADRNRIKPLVLHTIVATRGTHFAELARQSPIERHPEEQLRLLNNIFPRGEPQPGQTLKIVR